VNVLQNGTEKQLEKEINRQVTIGREHGKFIMSLGSPVTPQTKANRVKEYVSLTRKLSE